MTNGEVKSEVPGPENSTQASTDKPVSRLIVEFMGPYAADLRVRIEGIVTPMQELAAGEYLRLEGSLQLTNFMQARQRQQFQEEQLKQALIRNPGVLH